MKVKELINKMGQCDTLFRNSCIETRISIHGDRITYDCAWFELRIKVAEYEKNKLLIGAHTQAAKAIVKRGIAEVSRSLDQEQEIADAMILYLWRFIKDGFDIRHWY